MGIMTGHTIIRTEFLMCLILIYITGLMAILAYFTHRENKQFFIFGLMRHMTRRAKSRRYWSMQYRIPALEYLVACIAYIRLPVYQSVGMPHIMTFFTLLIQISRMN